MLIKNSGAENNFQVSKHGAVEIHIAINMNGFVVDLEDLKASFYRDISK